MLLQIDRTFSLLYSSQIVPSSLTYHMKISARQTNILWRHQWIVRVQSYCRQLSVTNVDWLHRVMPLCHEIRQVLELNHNVKQYFSSIGPFKWQSIMYYQRVHSTLNYFVCHLMINRCVIVQSLSLLRL
jgi:hypothetical protein